ncbi:hypothetical protein PAEPH01_1360 [Pancytospora epiphaga]|nr:hypothetical protein PAEPH01_1360 [Pancytospora epiphaga]
MDRLKTDETLAIECKGRATRDEVESILKESGISIPDFNGHIMSLLENIEPSTPLALANKTHIENRREEIYVASNPGDGSLTDRISRNIEAFYKIGNCPSFLYSDRLLSPKQYNFFLKIYSSFYMLDFLPSDEIARYLSEYIHTLTLQIVEKYTDGAPIEGLKKLAKE